MQVIHADQHFHALFADARETLGYAINSGGADLIFADPPFNIGVEYGAHCDDEKDAPDYERELREWISYASEAMKPTGSFWLHLPDRWAANAVVYGRDVLGLKLENWVVWHYRFGMWRQNRFINSKCNGLWFSKGNPKVHPEAALVPSDRAVVYADARTDGTQNPGMRMDLDVWGFDPFWGRVQGSNAERRPLHKNQLPELYLDRIIRLTTDPVDLVVDPFCGSGTTATVATTLKRRCYTGDSSLEILQSAIERIKGGAVRIGDGKAKGKKCKAQKPTS
jgi:DNA modification methylase